MGKQAPHVWGGGQRGPRQRPLSHAPRSVASVSSGTVVPVCTPKLCWGDGPPWADLGFQPMPFCLPLRPGPTQRGGSPCSAGAGAPKADAWPWQTVSRGTERVWAIHLGGDTEAGELGGLCTGGDNMVPGQRPGSGSVQADARRGLGVPGGRTPCPPDLPHLPVQPQGAGRVCVPAADPMQPM